MVLTKKFYQGIGKGVKNVRWSCPPPVFPKNLSSPWGSRWRDSDHHPKALGFPSDRACPEEFRQTEALAGSFVCREVVSGLFLRKTGKDFKDESGPAEPDDPNPSTPNPNIV